MAKSVRISIDGLDSLKAASKELRGRIEAEVEAELAAEAEQMADDARGNVRVDSADLQGAITAEVDGLSATVAPRSGLLEGPYEKAVVNEFGRSNDPGQPYMVPAAEASRKRWPKRAEEAVRRGTGG